MSADVSSSLKNWSTTEGSNSPSGSTAISSNLDDNLRMIQAVVRSALANKGSDISAASTTDIGAVEGSYNDITGSTTITGLGTVAAGIWKVLQFDSTPLLVHNTTAMGLPTSANITAAAGDHLLAVSLGSGNWTIPFYQRKNGLPLSADFPESFLRIVNSGGGKLAITSSATASGTRTVAFPDANLTLPAVAAKGDIVAGTAADVLGVATVGANDTILVADSAQSTGLAWRSKITVVAIQASTSGTSIDFNSVPSWVKRVTMHFNGVSLSGSSSILVQLGDSGGIEPTGYTAGGVAIGTGSTTGNTSTAGFYIQVGSAANVVHGSLVISLVDAASFLWIASGAGAFSNAPAGWTSGGSKSTSAAMDKIRLTTVNGTDTFDAGSVTITYE